MNNKSSDYEKYAGMISLEETIELAKKKDEGDQKAREKLIVSHLWCVEKYVGYYISSINPKVDKQELYKDLYQEGCFGLIKAVDKYDWKKNNYLSTYAQKYIRKYVLKYYADKVPYIRLPEKIFYANAKLSIFQIEFMSKHNRMPTIEECSKGLRVSLNAMKAIIRHRSMFLVKQDGEDDFVSFDDNISGEYYKTPEEIIQEIIPLDITEFDVEFSMYEEEIIKKYLGLDGNEPKKFKQIGEEFGISREKARRIYHSGIKKLKIAAGVNVEE